MSLSKGKSKGTVQGPRYTLTDAVVSRVEAIGEALGRFSFSEPEPPQLRRVNRIRTVQGSVAIEGNTLNEEQISAVLEGKRVLAPPQEILEVQNAWNAYEQLTQWQPTSESDLQEAHALLMKDLLPDAGKYRRKQAGIMGKQGIVYVAPPADRIPWLMKQLLGWLEEAEAHPLIAAAVFHYEFEFLHPFADGNGRLGRLWQTLILTRWNPLFRQLPVESMIHQNQQGYYDAINQSTQQNDAVPFVEFMLQVLLDTLRTDQENDQVTDQVKRLLRMMGSQPESARELMAKLELSHRPTFRKSYLDPALEAGWIERTHPDSPRARNQKYRLTDPGRRLRQDLE